MTNNRVFYYNRVKIHSLSLYLLHNAYFLLTIAYAVPVCTSAHFQARVGIRSITTGSQPVPSVHNVTHASSIILQRRKITFNYLQKSGEHFGGTRLVSL